MAGVGNFNGEGKIVSFSRTNNRAHTYIYMVLSLGKHSFKTEAFSKQSTWDTEKKKMP